MVDIFTVIKILEVINSALATFFTFTFWLGGLLAGLGLNPFQVNLGMALVLLLGLFAIIKAITIITKVGLIILGIWISASILGLI